MKKFVTLTLALGIVGFSFAQTSRDDARRVVLGGNGQNYPTNKYPNGQYPTQQGRDVILGGGNNGSYPQQYPGQYPNQYPQNRRRQDGNCNDRDRDRDRHEHHDNGKHKGWYKGKGNKHHDD